MIVETERLILREFQPGDWRAVLAYQADQRYLRYYPWFERNEYDARSFVQMCIDWQKERPRRKYQLAIVLKANSLLIGNVGLRGSSGQERVADLGYEIAAEYWKQGYATEAALVMLAFGFRSLHMHRIWANCISENAGSARVLEKIGMQKEGELRNHEYFKGRWWNTSMYGILENEWKIDNPGILRVAFE